MLSYLPRISWVNNHQSLLLNLHSHTELGNKWWDGASSVCGSANFSNLHQDFINSILYGLTLYIGGAGHCLRSGTERLLAFVTPAHAHTQLSPILKFSPLELLLSLALATGLQENLRSGPRPQVLLLPPAPLQVALGAFVFLLQISKGWGDLQRLASKKGKKDPFPWGNRADIP